MRIDLPYSDKLISGLDLPDDRLAAVYDMNPIPALEDLDTEIRNSLTNPIGAAPLRSLAAGSSKIALIVDDISRPTPVRSILPRLLEELAAAGAADSQITIVIALGSHRPMDKKEIIDRLGPDIVSRCTVINSRFNDPDSLIHMGITEDGAPVYIDKAVAAADFKIAVGSIVPHAAVGWSGGAKILYPGVSGKETVARFHAMHGLTERNMTGLDDCPVRERMEEWVDRIGLDFIVNCILTPEGGIYRVVSGHYVLAHRHGIGFAKKVYQKRVKEKTDIVISVSYPHDSDFWQVTKGLYSCESVVNDGGTLLLLSPCSEGVGPHPDYPEYIGRDDAKALLLDFMNGRELKDIDVTALCPAAMMAKIRRRIHCSVFSPGLPRKHCEKAGFEYFSSSVQDAVDTVLSRYPHGRISVVRHCDLSYDHAQ